jgi:hypothetical protein
MTESTAGDSTYESGHLLAQIITVVLVIFIIIALPHAGLSLAAIPLWENVVSIVSAEQGGSSEAALNEAQTMLKGITSVTYLGANLKDISALIGMAAIVALMTWIIRVHSNLGALGAKNLKYETVWAIAWWFIPFAHLFMPYKVILEIWQGSDPSATGEDLEKSSPSLVGWWWVVTAAAALIGLYYFPIATTLDLRAGSVNVVADLYLASAVAILAIGSAIMGILVVREIDHMQSMKYASLRGGGTATAQTA